MNTDETTQPSEEQRFIIPTEEVIEQREIDFFGDPLILARTASGIYVSIPGMCKAMGLASNSQIRRMINTNKLRTRLRTLTLMTRGGPQEVTCLDAKAVPMWLIGIESSKAKPAFQIKIDRYYEELEPLAEKTFAHVMGVQLTPLPPTPPDPRLVVLADQYETLMTTATFIREHMEALAILPEQVDSMSTQLNQAVELLASLAKQQEATTATLSSLIKEEKVTPAQKHYIKEAVNRIVDDTKGKPGQLNHAQVYAAIYHQFHVNSYEELPSKQYEEVITFLRDLWKRATSGATPEQQSLF